MAAHAIPPRTRSAPRRAPRAAIPPPPPATIRRERLERELDRHAARAVTAVIAPAGSGKTVLMASWAARRGTAWLSLRPDHLDVACLWHDIAAALRPFGLELSSAPGPAATEPEARSLALRRALDRAARRATLVLDDVHLLRGPALALVAAVAAECGQALGLAFASRADPDLRLGRLRLEGRLGELRAADLAFTPRETGALLAEHGLMLDHGQVERLLARTEGWAAGVRLAAVSLHAEPDADRFLADFAGGDHAVADYLSGEVLALQRPEVRRFLLRTSVAERLCADLADALTGGNDGGRTLVELHRGGVFLLPIDRQERWFRYHPLFAELLRARLRLEEPELWAELHGRAARWLAAHGLGREALPHVLEAGGTAGLSDVLADQWLDLLLGGQAPDAVRAAAALRRDDRRLAVAAAAACLGAGDAPGAEAILAAAGDEDDEAGALGALLLARARGDLAGARRAAARLLGRRADDSRLTVAADDARRSLALMHLGASEFAAGFPHEAADALDAAAALAVDGRRERVLLECHGRSAALELLAGRLGRAETAANAASSLAEPAGWSGTAACAWAYAALAAVHWLRDELPEAERRADAAAASAYAAGDVQAVHAVRLLRGHLAGARGDVERGRALIRTVLDGQAGTGPLVARWSDALGPCPWALDADEDAVDPLAAAAVRLARGDALSALRRVETVLHSEVPAHPTRQLHGWLVAGVAHQALGHSREASEALERALEIAAPEGHRRAFAEGGGAVRRLLQRHSALPTAYAPIVADLIVALERASGPPAGLLEPLSERELDVLRLLPTLLPNAEIAGELFVTVNTVKTHVKSVYRKLEVSSRREAVARARRLRLL